MSSSNKFKVYNLNQQYLLPQDMKEWLPDDHLAYFVIDTVGALNLKQIYQKYNQSKGGQPAFHPQMMVALLLYAYSVGIPSSRKIEKATYEALPFRIITADQHPDHDTIAAFRKRHLEDLAKLFVQVLRLCQKAGLVKLGHVALDGTKIKANASKHKAMSYSRMEKAVVELEKEVAKLMQKAQAVDDEEDTRYGKGKRGDELPEELKRRETRLKKIKEAMASLEAEAKEKTEKENKEKKNKGSKRKQTALVKPKAQRNFTDPESRIMKDNGTKSFEQAYNAQAAVDKEHQIIVANHITESAVDRQQLKPCLVNITKNIPKQTPTKLSADAGYYSEDNITDTAAEIDLYIPPCKEKKVDEITNQPRGRIPKNITVKERMLRKLKTIKGKKTYSKRKAIVEPVFGQIKQARGFRQFSFRGKKNVGYEWDIICLTHNMLKLFRSGWAVATN